MLNKQTERSIIEKKLKDAASRERYGDREWSGVGGLDVDICPTTLVFYCGEML